MEKRTAPILRVLHLDRVTASLMVHESATFSNCPSRLRRCFKSPVMYIMHSNNLRLDSG
jgi:hypothetical protein